MPVSVTADDTNAYFLTPANDPDLEPGAMHVAAVDVDSGEIVWDTAGRGHATSLGVRLQ